MTTPRSTWTPVFLLSASQALFFCVVSIVFTVSALAGVWLAPTPALATLPLALAGAATMLAALNAVRGFARFGRQKVFIFGAVCGVSSGLLSAWALYSMSFVAFCFTTALFGVFQGIAQYYRLAAADVAPSEADRPRAISWVVAGGLAAAFVGPYLGAFARDLTPTPFMGSYLIAACVGVLAVLVLTQWREPAAVRVPPLPAWKPALDEIAGSAAVKRGIAFCACGFAMMVLVMNAAPLAIVGCGLSLGVAASAIQWHLVGMFAPSFFTGGLIARFSAQRVALAGCGIGLAGCAVATAGETVALFHAAMIAVGIGWNFAYIGGSALLVQSTSLANRARILSFNETLTFGGVTVATLLSGFAQASLGWAGVGVVGGSILLIALVVFLALGGKKTV